jgi:hypothetical protein
LKRLLDERICQSAIRLVLITSKNSTVDIVDKLIIDEANPEQLA